MNGDQLVVGGTVITVAALLASAYFLGAPVTVPATAVIAAIVTIESLSE